MPKDEEYNEEYYEGNSQSGDRPALLMYDRLWRKYCGKGPILEFGGGVGWFARRLSKHAKLYACENNKFAEAQIALNAPNAIRIDSLNILEDSVISSVVGLHVLEHIPDVGLYDIFDELHRITHEDATFLFVMPNLTGKAHALKGDSWSAFSDPTHINLKSHVEWEKFFNSKGLKTNKCFADGYYDFPYGNSLTDKLIGDVWRLVKTGLQFLTCLPFLVPHDGENVVFILSKQT